MSRERRPVGLAARLLDYLKHNPDEYLSLPDVSIKFDSAPNHVANVVRELEHEGLVAVERVVRVPRS